MSSWKSWLFALCVACPVIAAPSGALAACATGEIDVLGDGTQCETTKFSVTTTSDATSLVWTMTALGDFYVDCGDGGTLTQNTSKYGTISGNTIIIRDVMSETTYTCTWNSAGVHTVRFAGTATRYNNTGTHAAGISFFKSGNGTQAKVAAVSGSLGTMFPVIYRKVPSFYKTFANCTSLSSVPAGVFSGIDTSAATNTSYMFSQTFYNCSNLTDIPAGLFSAIDTSAATNTNSMFSSTFSGCSNLTDIPADLFSAIDTSAATNTNNMFYQTFYNTGITDIPAELFSAIDTSAATDTTYMFQSTFSGCSNLTDIPAELFSAIDTSAATDTGGMFNRTFSGCSNLTDIPAGLFSAIDTSAATNTNSMFSNTFSGCSNLTDIPAELFSAIDTSAATNTTYMFQSTFSDCSNLTDIPAGLFSAIDTSATTETGGMFNQTFWGCFSLRSIPAGLFSAIDTSAATDTGDMFSGTFFGCSDLTDIPAELFSAIDTSSATSTMLMFSGTFSGCSNLTDIPAGLFSAIDTSSATDTMQMFNGTFDGCSKLGGYIPPTAFPNTIQPGSSTNSNMWSNTFTGTRLLTTCPVGTTQYITGFESDWGYSNSNVPNDDGSTRVSCEPCPGTLPEHASYTTAGTCGWACDSGYMNTGTQCEPTKFSVTTTELESGAPFTFSISASGTFYVDCGNGGTLSGDGVVGNVITRSGTTAAEYTCSWENAGANTIQFAGVATGYSTTDNVAAISFYGGNKTPTLIASIDGSLGALFPTIGDGGNGNQPRFFETFRGASNFVGPIPANLFSGVTGAPVSRMFNGTFRSAGLQTAIPSGLFAGLDGAPTNELFANTWRNCQNMTGPIPEDLFAGIHGAPATKMFFGTFAAHANDGGEGWAGENGKITGSIPAGLFAGISGAPAANMFHETFCGQSKLTGTIPENLFAGISGAPASSMFAFTFCGCPSLTGGIPENLFDGVSGAPAQSMFLSTFKNCAGLNGSIPAGLFAGISGAPAFGMFRHTFYACSGLTGSIPGGLFAGLQGVPKGSMFQQTFARCSNLTGAIPANLFAGISGAPATWMFAGTFQNCSKLSGELPAELFAGIYGAPKSQMFNSTFAGCSSLTGYIPPTFFAGISTETTIDDQMANVFKNSGLDTECPANSEQYMTGFEDFFTGKVSCDCNVGYYGNNDTCTACTNKPANSHYTNNSKIDFCGWNCDVGYHVNRPYRLSTDTQWKSHDGTDEQNSDGDLSAGQWKATWNDKADGTMMGVASCNAMREFSGRPSSDNFTNSVNGANCWCKALSWTPTDGAPESLSGFWFSTGSSFLSDSLCASRCAYECADSAYYGFDVLDSGSSISTCFVNTINIYWSDVDDNGTATVMNTDVLYNGDIVTPVKAMNYPGKIFRGWQFNKPDIYEGGE